MAQGALGNAGMLDQYVRYIETRVAKQQAVVAQLRACGLDPREDEAVLASLEGECQALQHRMAQHDRPAHAVEPFMPQRLHALA